MRDPSGAAVPAGVRPATPPVAKVRVLLVGRGLDALAGTLSGDARCELVAVVCEPQQVAEHARMFRPHLIVAADELVAACQEELRRALRAGPSARLFILTDVPSALTLALGPLARRVTGYINRAQAEARPATVIDVGILGLALAGSQREHGAE